jgi:hypothetical protein
MSGKFQIGDKVAWTDGRNIRKTGLVVVRKIMQVEDATCRKCGQCYDGECRAYIMPHSQGEEEARYGKEPLCYRQIRQKSTVR